MSKSQSEHSNEVSSKKAFWTTVALLHIYFIFFYLLVLVIFSRFAVSALLLIVPILIIAMVPPMEKGFNAYKAKSIKNEVLPAIGFLGLFALTKLIMIFSLHENVESLYIVNLESSAIDLIVVGFFILILALSVFFFFTTDSWVNRFIFLILTIYSLARVLNPFDIMPEVTNWIVQYLTLIALPLILGAIFIKAKLSKPTE